MSRRVTDSIKHELEEKGIRSDSGGFAEVVDDPSVVGTATVQMDNYDQSNSHAINVVGTTAYAGIHAADMQLTIPATSRPSTLTGPTDSEGLQLIAVSKALPTRDTFIAK